MTNILIILILVLISELNGFLFAEKINFNTKYYLPFGFLILVAFFEVFSIPLIALKVDYVTYRMIILTMFVIFQILFFIYTKVNLILIKKYINGFSKEKFYVYISASIVGFIVAIVSTNSSDSWLYLPMILRPIEVNKLTYATTGMHMYDGYYKFLSIITDFSTNNYMFLMVFYKFFEMIIVINFFGFIAEQVFKKKFMFTFITMSIAFVWQIRYFLPAYAQSEFLGAIYWVVPSGTSLLIGLITPLLFILIYKRIKSKRLLLLILLGGLGLSSSMIYIYMIYVLIDIFFDIFYGKKSDKKNIIVNLFYLLIPIGIYILYKIPKIIENEINISIYGFMLLLYILVCIILIFIKQKHFKKIYITMLIAYIVFIISCIIIMTSNNGFEYILDIIYKMTNVNLSLEKYPKDSYIVYMRYGVYSFLYVIGIYTAYKTDKKLLSLHLVVVVFFANYLAFQTIGSVISQAVYSRVFVFANCYIFTINGFIIAVDYLKNSNIKYKNKDVFSKKNMLIFTSIILLLSLNVKKFVFAYEPYIFNESLFEYKINNEDVIQLLDYDFDKSWKVKTPQTNRYSKDIDQIFQLNSHIDKVEQCEEWCYELIPRVSEFGPVDIDMENKVYLTRNYVLVYKK